MKCSQWLRGKVFSNMHSDQPIEVVLASCSFFQQVLPPWLTPFMQKWQVRDGNLQAECRAVIVEAHKQVLSMGQIHYLPISLRSE